MFRYPAVLLAAVLLILGAAHTASAQGMSFSFGGSYQTPEENIRLSQWYDHLLQVSPRFRAYRMRRECNPINWPSLHSDCLASFDRYEPVLAGFYR